MTLHLQQATLATRLADEHYVSNLRALRQSQPELAQSVEIVPIDGSLEWLFGRDRALTARDAEGRWLAGCSLPRRASREMLRRLDLAGAVGCFLAPTHAAQLAAALETTRPEQAVIALVPRIQDLAIMLRCECFASAINTHRLWFVSGPAWSAQLARLYEAEIGLATPAQFIRVPVTPPELIEPLIAEAQQAISQITVRRASVAEQVQARPWNKPARTRLCVVASMRFRLWNDAGHVLVSAAEEAARIGENLTWTLYDADDPACSSPLGLAVVARQCSALLSANTARCDVSPGLVPHEMPWITWIAGSTRIPSVSAAGPNDRLIVVNADAQRTARSLGWPESRIDIAGWSSACASANDPPADAPALSIIADTLSLEVPDALNEYSSHALLWEHVREELVRDPRLLGGDARRYLEARMRRLEIDAEGFAWHTFINQLIVPAYQQGLAGVLMEAKLPLRLHGQGWQQTTRLAAHAHGPIESRQHLASVLRATHALVHVWPTPGPHPIDFTGVTVVRPGWGVGDFLAAARRALVANPCSAGSSTVPLDGAALRRILCRR